MYILTMGSLTNQRTLIDLIGQCRSSNAAEDRMGLAGQDRVESL